MLYSYKNEKSDYRSQSVLISISAISITLFIAADFYLDDLIHEKSIIYNGFLHLFAAIPIILFTYYVWKNIKKHNEAENQLVEAIKMANDEKAKLESILKAVNSGMSIQDTNFVVLQQNEAHRRMSGGVHIGELCYKAYNQLDEVCPGCPVVRMFEEDAVVRIEKPGRSGSPVEYIEITASPVKNAEGKTVAALEVVHDITERKWVENALRLQNQFLQLLIDTIPAPVFYKNKDGIFLGCNQSFAECIGKEREEVVGRTLSQLIPLEFSAIYDDHERKLLITGGSERYESFVICAATGKKREVIFSQAVYKDENGDISGLVGVVTDVTEIHQAKLEIVRLNEDLIQRSDQLANANHELEAYNYSFTHDLKNKLTRIISSAQLLRENETVCDEESESLISNILSSASEIHELGEGMRILFSITRRELKEIDLNLSEIASTVILNLRLSESYRLIETKVESNMFAKGDLRLVRILFENLIGNSWKYTASTETACIEVGSEQLDGTTYYFVKDNGIGFDQQYAENLFLPFRRLPNSADFQGSGIGLATVQRIILHHGGLICAEGSIGKGSKFSFTLTDKGKVLNS